MKPERQPSREEASRRRSSQEIWIPDLSATQEGSTHPSRRRCVSYQWFSLCATILILAVASYVGGELSRRSLLQKLEKLETKRSQLQDNESVLQEEKAHLAVFQQKNEELAKNVAALKGELENTKAALQDVHDKRLSLEHDAEQIMKQDAMNADGLETSHRLRDDVTKLITTIAVDTYGPGPHQVEFQVRIWQGDTSQDGRFVVEVAPFELLPSTSFLFLEQVEHQLWDGTSFYLNTPTQLLAQPVSGKRDTNKLPKMEALGLARLPIEEYSDKMPHVKYTLGYSKATSTSGSFFYINKVDNSRTQRGQACFAKVVSGFDVVDRIAALETDRSNYIHPVDILEVRVVRSEDHEPSDATPTGGLPVVEQGAPEQQKERR